MQRTRDTIPINGAALRHIRRITGVTVSALAAEIGVGPSYISNIEAGRSTAIPPDRFAALCSALLIEDRRALMAQPSVLQSERVPA